MLCEHGLNPKACLKCFQTAQAQAPHSQPKPKAAAPYQNPVIQGVKARAGRMLGDIVPHGAGMVHMGTTPDGNPVAPPPEPAADPMRPKTRGKMPVPVIHVGGMPVPAHGQTTGQVGGQNHEPFSYANDTGRTDSKGVWHPPKHRSLVDSLPRHPNPNGSLPGK